MDTPIPHIANKKIARLVDYLLRMATLRSKLIRDIAEYEKILWLNSIPHERECFTQAWGRDEEHELDEWLEVQNRREPVLPSIPAPCKDWVNQKDLRKKIDLPELLPEIVRQTQNPDWTEGSEQPETIQHTERLEDHPTIQRAWDRYVEEKWLPWTESHNAWEQINKVYSTLFAIYQEQLRLGEEYVLVLGLGLLTWHTPNGQRVRRHLVVADANLEFEPRLGKFIVRPHTEGAKLRPELDMLDISDQPARAEDAARVSLSEADDDPWQKGCIEGVLNALVHSINPQGEYYDSIETKITRASTKPVVELAPALILRKRSSKGLTETLKRIKTQIEQGEDIPKEFADLAEVSSTNDLEPADLPQELNAAYDGEIYFPKPSNEEQRRIVDKLRTASGVLVQGPPGTGKSHTIANLICHLLATGQRTLITAKTPRALQVLEGLVPDELRPLCINLLGSGLEERRSLESSVGGILRTNEEWREEHAERQRAESEACLRKYREEKARVDRRIRDIRESETHAQSVAEGTYRGTAARIAEAVERNRALYEWFLDAVPQEGACRIQISKMRHLLDALRYLKQEKRNELDQTWPNVVRPAEEFAEIVEDEILAIKEENSSLHRSDERFTALLTVDNPSTIAALRDALTKFSNAYKKLRSSPHLWMKDALVDILSGNSSLWRELHNFTRNTIYSIDEFITLADQTTIDIPENCDIRVLYEDICKLIKHMENGGKIGWGLFRPKLVKECLYVIKSVKLDGHSCRTVENLSTLANVLNVSIECDKTWGVWVQRTDKVQGAYALQLATFKSLLNSIENALVLEELVVNFCEVKSQFSGLSEPVWTDAIQIEKLISSCDLALALIHRQRACEKIQRIDQTLSMWAAKNNPHPVTKELLSAVRDRNVDKYAQAVNKIQALEKERLVLRKADKELRELRDLAPQLADCLARTCNELFWEDRIQHIGEAWHWAQARSWITDYIRQEDLPALSKRAKQIEDEINGIIAKLASLHAWSFCFSRLKEVHRRHMQAWQQSMRRLGKGTGKHAPRHRREAQKHLNECRDAVPAWVMPLHRVWDTVSPAPGIFDVIIVDEASQCGVEALPLLYLGKKILIVGDDKQISPDAVGLPRDAVHRLMQEFLHDFHFQSTFDIESSLFDHGKLRYGTHRITLREHFRCMPEIIRFSNDLCYLDTPLIPLMQYGPNRLPPLEHVFVSGGYREGSNNRAINRPEAEAIVERIVEMCRDMKCHGKSIGVVVLQGEAQAALIENQLLERLGAEEMEQRRLICGNPYSFQGDERDVMLLSLVAATNERIGPLTKPADERRFNVAASRARDSMILFHSVTRDDLSTSCLRRKLLEFFENTTPQQIAGIDRDELERRAAQDNRSLVNPPTPFESWFEVDVALELLRKNYIVLSQYEVAGKRIDLVIEGGQVRLAVECDGDNWHGADRYEDDMQRQRQLERCGWDFFRVRESAFYANKHDALKGLWNALDEKGIYPQYSVTINESMPSNAEDEIIEEECQQNEPTNPDIEHGVEIKVEVEDTVIYVDIENPQIEKQALITYQKSNPEWGYININTPIAQALIGESLGATVEAKLPKGTIELLIKEIKKPLSREQN